MQQPAQSPASVNSGLAQRAPSSALLVKDLLSKDAYKRRFEEVLGKKAAPFMASVTQAAQSGALSRCEPKSIIAGAFVAATLDLPIDRNLGFAHLVPYGGVAQFQMGYKGFIQLALRTGQYRTINDTVIYEGELVTYDDLFGELKIDRTQKKSDKVIGYAASFKLINGFEKVVYWSRERVEAHARRYSKAFSKKDSPWQTNFDAMAIKTVIKHLLSKYGILSVEMQTALRHDQAAQTDIDAPATFDDSTIDLDGVTQPENEEKPDSPTSGISAALRSENPAPKTGVEAELDSAEPPASASDREKIIEELKSLMLDHDVSEAKLFGYATRAKLAPSNVDELWALPTEALAKLKFAVPSLKIGGSR